MTGRVLIQCESGHAWHGWEFAILERQPGRITTQVGTFLLRGETWRHAAFLDGSVTCILLADSAPVVRKRLTAQEAMERTKARYPETLRLLGELG